MTDGVFLAWNRHARTTDLAACLGLRAVVIQPSCSLLPVRYLQQTYRTIRFLRRERPRYVLVMQPPAPVLLVTLLAAGPGALLGADLHTGYFIDRRWSWFSAAGLRLLRGRIALVSNDELRRRCAKAGVRALVLHDVIAPVAPAPSGDPGLQGERPVVRVVVPLAYARDEPVTEILGAARLLPGISFVLTGDPPAELVAGAPGNVSFSGFVDDATYAALMGSADAVLACTTRSHTMLRAGYEAMRFGVPLVTSDAPVLRDFFRHAAAYADNSASGIARAVGSVMGDRDAARQAMADVRSLCIAQQADQLQQLRELLDVGP